MGNPTKTTPLTPASTGALLAAAINQTGPLVVIDSGLIGPTEATSLQRALPPAMTEAERRGLRLLRAMTWHEIDPEVEPDIAPFTVVQPAWLGLFEAALRASSQPWSAGMQSVPWAAWAAQSDGLDPAPNEHWMQLLPCRVSLTAQAVGLVPLAADAFTEAQVQCMTELVASWPASLVQAPSGGIFLRAQESFGLWSSTPESLTGLHLAHHLPVGPRSADWRRLASEIEMAFFALASDAPNQAETVWPWGAGALPAVNASQSAQPIASSPVASHVSPTATSNETPSTVAAPQPISGMLAWLSKRGSAVGVSWHQAEDLDTWTHAWLAAFNTIAEAHDKQLPWTLKATQASQARVWSSLSPSHSAPRPEGEVWQTALTALQAGWQRLLGKTQEGRQDNDNPDWRSWLGLAARSDPSEDGAPHGE
ncbi:MAG: hypothetical protein ACO3WN_06675 [Burkholderiaceae bacterium]